MTTTNSICYEFKIIVVDIDEGPFATIYKTVKGPYDEATNYMFGYIQGLKDSGSKDYEFIYENISTKIDIGDGIVLTCSETVQERSVMNGN
tara:strand:+ start:221 stop:493 length:273 start_codon:yes stop_codon:yes gene_type:complete